MATSRCLEITTIYKSIAIPNIITDVILVILPMPYMWRLHAPLVQRIVLLFMFTLGTSIAIVSTVRLVIFLHIPAATAQDVTHNFREVVIWSVVELNVAVICACLPSLKPLVSFAGLNKIFTLTEFGESNNRKDSSKGISAQDTSD
jgi:ABC-type Mn2+/Zn2+ transport system permease subunit